MNTSHTQAATLSRQGWMRLLALAPEQDLCCFMRPFAERLDYSFLRKPESGLLMVEGKTGSTRFNLGEMLITRCAVALNSQQTLHGYAWISGNRPEHALSAALCDAMMQLPEYYKPFSEQLFPLLLFKEAQQRAMAEQEAAPTRVEFFTMVRGEDA